MTWLNAPFLRRLFQRNGDRARNRVSAVAHAHEEPLGRDLQLPPQVFQHVLVCLVENE
jgi:hypothetical protein